MNLPDFTRAQSGSAESRLQNDTFREIAGARAELQKSNRWQTVQTGILVAQTAVMASIHQQMEEAKRQNATGLSIQQELLNREQLQSQLEEFVYQTEKLVAEFSDSTTDIPSSTRYFLLVSIQQKIEVEGISTTIIRGRDNKAAFDKVFADVQRLRTELEAAPEVQQAIEEAERAEAKRTEKLRKLEQQMVPLRTTRSYLEQSKDGITFQDAIPGCWKFQKERTPKIFHLPLLIGLGLSVILIFPLAFLIPACAWELSLYRARMNQELNDRLDKEITAIDQKLKVLEDDAETA